MAEAGALSSRRSGRHLLSRRTRPSAAKGGLGSGEEPREDLLAEEPNIIHLDGRGVGKSVSVLGWVVVPEIWS